VILGAVGGRWDQTLANLHLLASPRWIEQRIEVVDGPQRVFPIHPQQQFELPGEEGDLVSLIPVGGDAHGVEIHGFKYPLQNETLCYDKSRGTSNVLIAPPGRISLQEGRLLCSVIRGGEGEMLHSGGK
jgi:thiamine pyrophosphokinase